MQKIGVYSEIVGAVDVATFIALVTHETRAGNGEVVAEVSLARNAVMGLTLLCLSCV